jgi:serine/threonine protein kinase
MSQFDNFGKYRILRKLSRSMTDVYLAYDSELERKVVLKLIEYSSDECTKVAIEAERRGAAIQDQLHKLDSRILEVYDFGDHEKCFFVAMEYFEGKTVAELLRAEHRFDAKRAARYAAEACDQLKTLHAFVSDLNGRKSAVIHGDIKPTNLQIGSSGELKLLDFGIAKVITATHNLTRHNFGSPNYCSPERLSNSQVDPSADLWALGVTLYEMVAGAPPYQAQDTRRLENLIQSRRPPRALPDTCPHELTVIIRKALAGDLSRRYQTAAEFEADLKSFMESRAPVAARTRPALWNANATVQKHSAPTVPVRSAGPVVALKAARLKSTGLATNLLISLLSGALAGLILFIPISYGYRVWADSEPLRAHKDYAHEPPQVLANDWALYTDLARRHSLFANSALSATFREPLRKNLISAGDNIIDGFRNSSDARLSDFDWARARLCFRHASELDRSDPAIKGKLALCEGYLSFIANPRPPRAGLSVNEFRQAESFLPRSPDPHLALARVYVSAYHNIGEASAEFHEAEQLGFHLGPREQEEEADGYVWRAGYELNRARQIQATNKSESFKWAAKAKSDIERARVLYEPISGFSAVDSDLQSLDNLAQQEAKLEPPPSNPVLTKWKSIRRVLSRYWH